LSEIPASSVASYAGAAVGDYVEILKAPGHVARRLHRVRWACFGAGASSIRYSAAVAVLCIAVGAGASGAINIGTTATSTR